MLPEHVANRILLLYQHINFDVVRGDGLFIFAHVELALIFELSINGINVTDIERSLSVLCLIICGDNAKHLTV